MDRVNRTSSLKNQILENLKGFEQQGKRYLSGMYNRRIKRIKSLDIKSLDYFITNMPQYEKEEKNEYYYEFIKSLLNKFPNAEAYSIEFEKIDDRTVDRIIVAKITNDILLAENGIFFTKDFEKFKYGKINMPIFSNVNGKFISKQGIDFMIKGIGDLIKGRNTEEAKILALLSFNRILFKGLLYGELKNNINYINMKENLDKYNLKSIAELSPVKMFYLFYNNKPLTSENLKEAENLTIDDIKNVGFVQQCYDAHNLSHFFMIPKDDKTFKACKLIAEPETLSNYFKKFVEDSKLGTYNANSWILYKQNLDIYRATVNHDIDCSVNKK